jgi:hypothetical protein
MEKLKEKEVMKEEIIFKKLNYGIERLLGIICKYFSTALIIYMLVNIFYY